MGPVAELLAIDRTTLTAALKPLHRRGLVSITSDGKDRRTRRLALTEAGRDLLAEAMRIWCATHADLERALPDAARLRADLRALG